MLDHVIITVKDLDRSIAFYEMVLKPLGIVHALDYDGKNGPEGHPDLKGFGRDGRVFFWLRQGDADAKAAHIGFEAIPLGRPRTGIQCGQPRTGVEILPCIPLARKSATVLRVSASTAATSISATALRKSQIGEVIEWLSEIAGRFSIVGLCRSGIGWTKFARSETTSRRRQG